MKEIRLNIKIVTGFGFILLIMMLPCTDTYCQVTKEWETESVFLTPESIVFDSLNNCLYVSNFNDKGGFRKREDKLHDECISKLDIDGNIKEFKWVDSLLGPTGLAIYNNQLFIVERDGLSIVNIDKRNTDRKILVDSAGFLNDVVVDNKGIAYVSDSRNNCIYKIHDGKSEVWFSDTLMTGVNGLLIDKNNLLIGNSGNANLISISLTDKTIEIIAREVVVNIDGIKKLNDNYLVSWRSEICILEPDGKRIVLFKSDNEKDFLADFEYLVEDKLIIIPTLSTNKVIALKIND
jgi:sugar lactone lactonase YvrE